MEDKKELTNQVLGGLFDGSLDVDGQQQDLTAGIDKPLATESTGGSSATQGSGGVNINVQVDQHLIQNQVEKAVDGILATSTNPQNIKKNYTESSQPRNTETNIFQGSGLQQLSTGMIPGVVVNSQANTSNNSSSVNISSSNLIPPSPEASASQSATGTAFTSRVTSSTQKLPGERDILQSNVGDLSKSLMFNPNTSGNFTYFADTRGKANLGESGKGFSREGSPEDSDKFALPGSQKNVGKFMSQYMLDAHRNVESGPGIFSYGVGAATDIAWHAIGGHNENSFTQNRINEEKLLKRNYDDRVKNVSENIILNTVPGAKIDDKGLLHTPADLKSDQQTAAQLKQLKMIESMFDSSGENLPSDISAEEREKLSGDLKRQLGLSDKRIKELRTFETKTAEDAYTTGMQLADSSNPNYNMGEASRYFDLAASSGNKKAKAEKDKIDAKVKSAEDAVLVAEKKYSETGLFDDGDSLKELKETAARSGSVKYAREIAIDEFDRATSEIYLASPSFGYGSRMVSSVDPKNMDPEDYDYVQEKTNVMHTSLRKTVEMAKIAGMDNITSSGLLMKSSNPNDDGVEGISRVSINDIENQLQLADKNKIETGNFSVADQFDQISDFIRSDSNFYKIPEDRTGDLQTQDLDLVVSGSKESEISAISKSPQIQSNNISSSPVVNNSTTVVNQNNTTTVNSPSSSSSSTTVNSPSSSSSSTTVNSPSSSSSSVTENNKTGPSETEIKAKKELNEIFNNEISIDSFNFNRDALSLDKSSTVNALDSIENNSHGIGSEIVGEVFGGFRFGSHTVMSREDRLNENKSIQTNYEDSVKNYADDIRSRSQSKFLGSMQENMKKSGLGNRWFNSPDPSDQYKFLRQGIDKMSFESEDAKSAYLRQFHERYDFERKVEEVNQLRLYEQVQQDESIDPTKRDQISKDLKQQLGFNDKKIKEIKEFESSQREKLKAKEPQPEFGRVVDGILEMDQPLSGRSTRMSSTVEDGSITGINITGDQSVDNSQNLLLTNNIDSTTINENSQSSNNSFNVVNEGNPTVNNYSTSNNIEQSNNYVEMSSPVDLSSNFMPGSIESSTINAGSSITNLTEGNESSYSTDNLVTMNSSIGNELSSENFVLSNNSSVSNERVYDNHVQMDNANAFQNTPLSLAMTSLNMGMELLQTDTGKQAARIEYYKQKGIQDPELLQQLSGSPLNMEIQQQISNANNTSTQSISRLNQVLSNDTKQVMKDIKERYPESIQSSSVTNVNNTTGDVINLTGEQNQIPNLLSVDESIQSSSVANSPVTNVNNYVISGNTNNQASSNSISNNQNFNNSVVNNYATTDQSNNQTINNQSANTSNKTTNAIVTSYPQTNVILSAFNEDNQIQGSDTQTEINNNLTNEINQTATTLDQNLQQQNQQISQTNQTFQDNRSFSRVDRSVTDYGSSSNNLNNNFITNIMTGNLSKTISTISRSPNPSPMEAIKSTVEQIIKEEKEKAKQQDKDLNENNISTPSPSSGDISPPDTSDGSDPANTTNIVEDLANNYSMMAMFMQQTTSPPIWRTGIA